jgi:hypothetical protein
MPWQSYCLFSLEEGALLAWLVLRLLGLDQRHSGSTAVNRHLDRQIEGIALGQKRRLTWLDIIDIDDSTTPPIRQKASRSIMHD